jgi:hypothetical protein
MKYLGFRYGTCANVVEVNINIPSTEVEGYAPICGISFGIMIDQLAGEI